MNPCTQSNQIIAVLLITMLVIGIIVTIKSELQQGKIRRKILEQLEEHDRK